MNRYVLLTVGKTHSGKSTFANDLVSEIPNCVVLETDPIALFLRSTFNKLHALDLDHMGSFASPALKYLVFRTVLSFALEHDFNIIMSNSNMYENGRKNVLNIIKKYPVKTIGVYLNFHEEILTERVKHSGRDTSVLSVSKDFNDLIVNQRVRFQPPNRDDFDYFFEVTHPDKLPEVKNQILELYK